MQFTTMITRVEFPSVFVSLFSSISVNLRNCMFIRYLTSSTFLRAVSAAIASSRALSKVKLYSANSSFANLHQQLHSISKHIFRFFKIANLLNLRRSATILLLIHLSFGLFGIKSFNYFIRCRVEMTLQFCRNFSISEIFRSLRRQ